MKKEGEFFGAALFFIFLLIYYLGSFSKVPFGDGIGFVTDIEKQEFVFSTNTYAHFLFTNIGVFFQKLFPFVESAEIAKFVTITSAAGTVAVFYWIVSFLGNSFSGFFGAVIFGFSFSFWKNAEIVEIYTLNIFCIALFIFFIIKFLMERREKWLLFGSVILGISMFSHIQNILLIPAFLLVLTRFSDFKTSVKCVAVFTFFLFLLFLIPILNNEPVSGVISSGTALSQINYSGFLKSFVSSFAYLLYNFWYFTVLAFFGMVFLYRSNFKIFIFLIAIAVPVYCFSVFFNVSDNYVFFIPFNFTFAVFIAFGIFALQRKKWIRMLAYTAFLIPAFYYVTFKIASQNEKAREFSEKKEYKGGLRYYLLPWMKNNVGILEFTIENRQAPEAMYWMTRSAKEFILLKKAKGYNDKQIKKL